MKMCYIDWKPANKVWDCGSNPGQQRQCQIFAVVPSLRKKIPAGLAILAAVVEQSF